MLKPSTHLYLPHNSRYNTPNMEIKGETVYLTTSEAEWIIQATKDDFPDLARGLVQERRKQAAAHVPSLAFDGVAELLSDIPYDNPDFEDEACQHALAEAVLPVVERGYAYNPDGTERHVIETAIGDKELALVYDRARSAHAGSRTITTRFNEVTQAIDAMDDGTAEAIVGPVESLPQQEEHEIAETFFTRQLGTTQVTAGIIAAIDQHRQ